jgi:hypothetical protein
MYRINRPRASQTVPDLSINRLSTWSGVMWQQVIIDVGSGQSGGAGVARYGAALETDFSTEDGRRDPMGPPQLLQLLDELQRMTLEVAADGDRS